MILMIYRLSRNIKFLVTANNPKLFPKSPRTYGGEIPEFNQIHQPQLTDIGRRLAGFD